MPRSSEKSSLREAGKLLADFRVPAEVTSVSIEQYFTSLDCPRSLACLIMYRENEHEQLAKLEIDPLAYKTANDFRDAYCATKFLSKADFLKVGWDRKAIAVAKFLEFEELCSNTNKRFRFGAFDPQFKGSNVWLLNATKRKIASILGAFDVCEVLSSANWGPGVTNSIKGAEASGINKFQREVGITRDLYSHIKSSLPEKIRQEDCRFLQKGSVPLMMAYPLWFANLLERGFPDFEVGNTIVTVPKDAKTDRVICVEPGINLWFQLGIGKVLQRKLRFHGVDLRSQEVNQWRAKHAVKHGLATVDFSSASDSISLELVRELLPPDWFEWMNTSRSAYGIEGGNVRRWEKFSSMGNGFTFPLESLIFYSAAVSVAEYLGLVSQVKWINAYGDDVIVPSAAFELYSKFCDFLGFRVNQTKSFASGPFRESCGSHYFLGVDVKPLFLKKRITTPFEVYKLANGVRLLSHRVLNCMGCDAKFRPLFVQLVRSVPKSLRFKISLGRSPEIRAGDGGFVSNFDEACPPIAKDGIEGYISLQAAVSPVRGKSDEVGLLLYRLWNISGSLSPCVNLLGDAQQKWTTIQEGNTYPLRGRTRPVVRRIVVNQWYDLGPWF